MKIIIEVLPSKIDYKEDYKAILKDVNEEIYNLAYGFLSENRIYVEVTTGEPLFLTSNKFNYIYT